LMDRWRLQSCRIEDGVAAGDWRLEAGGWRLELQE